MGLPRFTREDLTAGLNARKVAHKRSSAVAYLYTNAAGRLCAMAFIGKSSKPAWRYAFPSEEARAAAVARLFEQAEANEARRRERQAQARAPHKLQLGHVLVSTWGYEQTNVDYFQVTRVVSDRTVEVRPIASTTVQETGWLQGRSAPLIDSFTGEAVRRQVRHGEHVRIDEVRSASLWDGRPVSWTAYH